MREFDRTKPAITAKHYEENGVGYLKVRFEISSLREQLCSASSSYVAPVRLNPDSWQEINPCTEAVFKVFAHGLRGVFVTAGYLPFGAVAIHLGSFVHVFSRLQLCGATAGRVDRRVDGLGTRVGISRRVVCLAILVAEGF